MYNFAFLSHGFLNLFMHTNLEKLLNESVTMGPFSINVRSRFEGPLITIKYEFSLIH